MIMGTARVFSFYAGTGIKNRPKRWIALCGLLVCLAFSLLHGTVHALTCDMLSMNVGDARSALRKAARETDLDSAQDYARRAKNGLEDSAMSAMDCGCDTAYMEFDDAASHARRARDADEVHQFVHELDRAIRAFNFALDALQTCKPRPR